MKKRKDNMKQRGMVITVPLNSGVNTYQAVGVGATSLGRFESYRRAQLAALIHRHFHAMGYENITRTMDAV